MPRRRLLQEGKELDNSIVQFGFKTLQKKELYVIDGRKDVPGGRRGIIRDLSFEDFDPLFRKTDDR